MTIKNLLIVLLLIVISTGCLTVERKEYRVTLNEDGSGTMTIRFINIVSKVQSETDSGGVDIDFDNFITKYVEGDKITEDMPKVTNIKKRIFEENGVLNGEVSFDFKEIQDIKLFSYDEESPYMMFIGRFGESFKSSNGEYGGQDMPVIFWPKSSNVLEWTIRVENYIEGTKSLLNKYKDWKSNN